MKTIEFEYTSEKRKFIGYLAWDDTRGDQRPGVLVFPEAFGLNDHARHRAQRLAQLGFVALAADIYGDGAVYHDMASLAPVIKELYGDRSVWRSRLGAALGALTSLPQVDQQRVAAIGFCFGGACCFELARSGAPLAAIAAFHAGIVPELPADAGQISAKVLICQGANDPVVKKDVMDAILAELSRDKVDWELIYHGNTGHSFTDPDADARGMPGFGYSKRADDRSWAAMRQLFDEAFA